MPRVLAAAHGGLWMIHGHIHGYFQEKGSADATLDTLLEEVARTWRRGLPPSA
jgi:hypothetical protein